MNNINLPQEIFELIINHLKSQKYSITTIRCLSRTCQILNTTLHDYILYKQEDYWDQYIAFGCYMNMTPYRQYINERILDGLLDKIAYDGIVCYAAAITCNVDLMKLIPIRNLRCELKIPLGKCVGFSGNYEMFGIFKTLKAGKSFWIGCFRGALLSNNIEFLEYCHVCDMFWIIKYGIENEFLSEKYYKWLVAHGYHK